ncbi:response regulator [Dyadobacter sp. LJ53]|uniref:response regulator n=1 Tax=Dyadobacter chenwenxiniae TaxID=2906456 RepID=UPI001F462092|nr:response regulator [Dyadobacter chenwenxiniae]MCF0048592.1 response regulator [Dyadobacter chenwenxiniae]
MLDLDMPVMDGFQVCMHIRSQIWGAKLPIIAFTGKDLLSLQKNCTLAGFDNFLSEPASQQELATSIVSTYQ